MLRSRHRRLPRSTFAFALAFVSSAVFAIACSSSTTTTGLPSTNNGAPDPTDPSGSASGENSPDKSGNGNNEDGGTTSRPAKCAAGCGDNQVCSEGKCVDLPKTCPCPVESYCDLANNSCKAGCTSDDECSKGRFCDESSRKCKDGCRTANDCSKPANGTVACNAGTCAMSCNTKFHACGASCKSDTDPTACGAACTVCPVRANAVAACVTGACQSTCEAGFHECGGTGAPGSGQCSANTSTASCGPTSCTPCPTVANGQPTCDGTTCGIKCNAGYFPNEAGACVQDCVTTGCGTFQWCDSTGPTASHLCKAGCERHDECGASQFCKIATHTCENTTSSQSFCPTGFVSRGTCSDGRDMCVNASLPTGTTHVFNAACPAGKTARGNTFCSGPTYVCVPNDPPI